MLEDQVAYLLQRYLGNYVRGLNKEALKISVWRGDVELTNMQLKPEALNALKLPVKVKAGFLGSVKLKVPWSRLGQEPVIVYLDRILILAEPATQVEGFSEDAIQEAKRSRVREMETKLLESWQQQKSEMNASWLGSLISTIIGNLKLSITNVHIRYEDCESNPGHPFAAGVTLRRLSAVTVDDSGKETFASGGALERIRKSVELECLALYLDSDVSPWNVEKPWHDLLPSEFSQIFELGNRDAKPSENLPANHSYVLQPVTGNAIYTKLQPDESRNTGLPLQKATISLDDVTLCLSKDGYRDILKLADNFTSFNQGLKYAHYRPSVPIKVNPRAWWKYAYKVVVDEMKKASGKFSWEHVLRYGRLRKRYVSLYASLLKSNVSRMVVDNNEDIEKLDRELDIEVILQWRMLAHKFVEQTTGSDVYLNKQKQKSSWWSFGWSGSSKDGSEPRSFSEEDWEQLNKIIGYKEDSGEQSLIGQGRADLLLSVFEIHMKHNASKLLTDGQKCLADLSCDLMDFSVKLYPETKIFDLKLGSYRLLSPSGLLAESATDSDSLIGMFIYKPFGAQIDWSFTAKASPCYMTYLKDSIDQIISFFKSSTALSQTMALETAAAVQTTIDEVRRTAQQQVTRALKDQARFSLDLDIAAPKITIPTIFFPDDINATKLLLDLGNLTLSTQDYWELDSSDEKELYLQFNVILSDVSAFLVDGDYSWGQTPLDWSNSVQSTRNSFFPVIDKCGIALKLQQIQSESPLHPSTRLSIRLPSLGFHFSPARYHRLMQVAKIFQNEGNEAPDMVYPWSQADFEGWVSLLSWKGVGNREAIWKHRYLSLVGPFLYILENPSAKTYKQYQSLRGKQVTQVPRELAGNMDHVLAIYDAMHSNAKVVEDANALILLFDTDDSCKIWQNRLQGAIYRVSGSAAIASLSDISSPAEVGKEDLSRSSSFSNLVDVEKLFVTGVLDELKICFSYNKQNNQNFSAVLLARESCLFEFHAVGGQVELSIRENDLFIGTLLKSLEIEDQFQCENIAVPRYLARSSIKSADANTTTQSSSLEVGKQNSFDSGTTQLDSDEQFFEASDSLGDFTDSSVHSQGSIRGYFSALNTLQSERLSMKPPNFSRLPGLLPDSKLEMKSMDFEGTDTLDSFVKAQVVFYHQDSPLYSNIDKQVTVTLATLSFFCHRPTILAILEFVNAINLEEDRHDKNSDISSAGQNIDISENDLVDKEVSDVMREPVAKGLLGKGKSRVIFYITLRMSQAQIFLVNENATYLATLSQNNLLTDIKVFPSSFTIKAALGNLKISDDSLPSDHSYFWLCDMRNPGGSSFVELDFSSFGIDDDDYCGYDYGLSGQLSEVRIVYLNRFVQEVVSYFMGLVPSGSKGIVKLKDQVSNSEKWFTTNEFDGSPALKLDLSLTKPIIVMPRRTDSLDYLELDVLHITVQNSFQWLGGDKNEMNAVHMEMMTIQIKEINLTVGTGETLGESIIEDVKGLSIVIQRSLRDLFHQIPATEAVIKVEELRAALSNSEYQIITECSLSNISETPHIVPTLDLGLENPSDVGVDMGASVSSDGVEFESQERVAWIAMKVSVSTDLVELRLHSGATRESPLATVQASGAWLLYKSSSSGESSLWATLKGFSVIDDREGTKQEFRHAIGKHESVAFFPLHDDDVEDSRSLSDSVKTDRPEEIKFGTVLTMLILDVQFKKCSTIISLCVQRPHLLVAPDFLLAIAEFFVPTVRTFLSNDSEEDLLHLYGAIIVDCPIYIQPSREFSISPRRTLIFDDERYDYYIYDGRGGSLYLQDSQGTNLSGNSTETVIFVGNGKRLDFKNVFIKNGDYLDSCIFLGSDSSYSASEDDNVFLERGDKGFLLNSTEQRSMVTQRNVASRTSEIEYLIEFQAVGPELTFYNTSKDVGESFLLSNKLLHMELDFFCKLLLKGDTTEFTGNMLGLNVESNGIRVLEPFDTSIKFSNVSGRTNISLCVSDVLMNFTFSILRLFLAIEEDILAFVRTTSKKASVMCSEFDKVGTIQGTHGGQTYAFWRPRAPPGFAVLGDCLTPLNKPPSRGILAVNTSFIKVKRPISYKLIWPPSATDDSCSRQHVSGYKNASTSSPIPAASSIESGCSIWFPIAPQGYVTVGCVVSSGRTEPPLSSSLCILASLVSPCSLKDCISLCFTDPHSSNVAFWRVENYFGSFLPSDQSMCLIGKAYELRQLCLRNPELSTKASKTSNIHGNSPSHDCSDQLQRSALLSSGRPFEAVASFRLIWWNQGASYQQKLSIWRPVVPNGMVYFGDVAVQGYEPPNPCLVLRHAGDGALVKPPLDFQLVGRIKKQKRVENISLWFPQAPHGFVSLGCIASKSSPKHDDFSSLRCIRSDMVTGYRFPEESIWHTADTKVSKEQFSIWSVGNEVGTFVVRRGFKPPPKRFALKLADPGGSNTSDNTVVDAEIRTFSIAVYDDYGGLMVPLFNISVSGIGFSLHGRPDYMNSTVSFSLTGRSYNDKYDSWEPVIEPMDGFLRYQYDLNSPGAVSQLRITSTRDLDVNISASNMNMILQAYSSWNSLSHVHESYRNREMVSQSYGGRSIIDVHQKRNYHIIPRNKLGQDIFIRATEMKRYSTIIKMPSGDNKPVKVPVPKNMLDSHLKGKLTRVSWSIMMVVIAGAEFPEAGGLKTGQYVAAVRLLSNQPDESVVRQQSARTSGVVSEHSLASNQCSVTWDETFFFKVDFPDNYTLEFIVTDLGTGEPIGFYSSPLVKMACRFHPGSESCDVNLDLTWRKLSSMNPMEPQGDRKVEPGGRLRCAAFLPVIPENEDYKQVSISNTKHGFIQISPTREGPWTTVRLNYATPASCWRLGNEVVASELTVVNGTRYVNIRSLVSVTNNTGFAMDLRLKSKESNEKLKLMDYRNELEAEDIDGSLFETDEFFETEKYVPSIGWVSDSSSMSLSTEPALQHPDDGLKGISSFQLPSGWEWTDDWHIDKSSVNNVDGWVYAPDLELLRWPDSFSHKNTNHARQRRWVRHRKYIFDEKDHIPLSLLNPGDTIPLPLRALAHPVLSYFLQLRPKNSNNVEEYSWSVVRMENGKAEFSDSIEELSEICVSSLSESEKLLYCSQVNGNSSDSTHGLWFSSSIQPIEIGKDIHSDPIHDWKIVVNSPLLITNFLPLPAEYSILIKQRTGEFVTCSRRILIPGETAKFYCLDLQDPLYVSLLLQGWDPMHDPVLVSHSSKLPSKTATLRNSFSGRIAQIVLDQSHEKENSMAQHVRVYAPNWIASARCPPLVYRFQDISERKERRKSSVLLDLSKSNEKVLWQITEAEMLGGYTITSAMNFKHFGLSASIGEPGSEHFGPVKDLSPLRDMDGSLDLYAFDANGGCIRIFISSKPCPYTAVPTKVISVRPFMTFTNRIGEDILLKFSASDQPKVLHASDFRVSFVYYGDGILDKLQVKLEDTDWSFPDEIVQEGSFTIMLRKYDGGRRFLRAEIRGYEEGSRFLVAFRLGSSNGPIRIENRIAGKKVEIRQSGSDDGAWIQIQPLSTTNFSWVNPLGQSQRQLDICVHDEIQHFVQNVSLEKNSECPAELRAQGILLHVLEIGHIKIARFTAVQRTLEDTEAEPVGYRGTLSMQDETENSTEPMELMVELGVVGISLIDHKPRELLFLYLERVFVSYSTGYDDGTTSRFKLIMGQVQLDNQIPLTMMPVLLALEQNPDACHPVFKTTITMKNKTTDGTQVYPYVYIRVTDKCWRLSIHEPIIWSLMDLYNNIHLDRLSNSSDVVQVDPELRIEKIDISEIRLKLSLETAPTQRPLGVLGMWSPILSAIGNALKIQVHLRKVEHTNRFMRKSSILPSILNRIKRDLIHDPLHLIFSVDVFGMTKSTFASLSKGFAELSTDGQFLQLRSKQVWSRRITGVSDGILQGTEALAQGVAFGVSGVVTKPVESARQHGLLGLAHGLGLAFLGFIVQPVSGALDFVSLTVDGISASFASCLEFLSNRAAVQRIRNPRAIHANGVLKEYCEREAVGQMILCLAEASRQLGCTDLFKEPSKYAWSDCYEDHFTIPYHRILLVTNKRVMLLQCLDPDKMDKRPCKIIWDIPWEELMALELAKAGFLKPTYLIMHLKNLKRSESFVRLVRCSIEDEGCEEPNAVRICSAMHKIWKAHQTHVKTITLKVPSSQRHVHFAWEEADGRDSFTRTKTILKTRDFNSALSVDENRRFIRHTLNFQKIWSSERESRHRCTLCPKQVSDDGAICSIWRPLCPDGYISIGDIARLGTHPPNVASIYRVSDGMFASPIGYDLVWRNCVEDYISPVSIWHPRAPEGFVSIGCVGVDGFEEPGPDSAHCVNARIAEETLFEDQIVWNVPDSYPWSCYFYQVQSEALHFVALRQPKEESDWKPMRVSEHQYQQLPEAREHVDDRVHGAESSSRS